MANYSVYFSREKFLMAGKKPALSEGDFTLYPDTRLCCYIVKNLSISWGPTLYVGKDYQAALVIFHKAIQSKN